MMRTVPARTGLWLTFVSLGLVGGFAGTAAGAAAQDDVTFTRDVAPILYESCVRCHRPGEVSPMALRTYEETRPWASAIKESVRTRQMPPWFADPAHGTFANDPSLSEEEIDTIVRWVDNGVREGDPADLPELPEFVLGWQLGEPDFIIALPEVNVLADGPDYFPNLNVTVDLPEDRWVRAIEVRPSAREVAHHIVLFSSPGGAGRSGFFNVLAVWAVGTPPTVYADGMGRWLRNGQTINTNMHYHPNGTAATDQARIGFYFGEGELKKEITAALPGNMTFEIPARAPNHEVTASYIIDQDISVVSFFPHMHLRGNDMRLTALFPGGRRETLLNIPGYSFNWQLFYYPETLVSLPKGTRIDIVAHYDNSESNPTNPDHTRSVGFGLQSTDEMMFGMFEFIADDGVSPKPTSNRSRIDALLSTLPGDSAYRVRLQMGRRTVSTALHLPREGQGTWYVPMQRQLMTLSATDIAWNGNAYRFNVQMRLGPIGGNFVVSGTVSEDGTIRGDFESDGAGTVPFSAFEGARTGATP